MDLSNENTIKELAKEYRIEPSALKGQNFLVDKKVLNKIVDSAKINSKDNILEIGPGFGILTKQLIKKSKKLIAVEMDEKIVKYLNDTYKDNKKIDIIRENILKVSNSEISKLFNSKDGYRIVSNIPYQITGKLIKKFVSDTNEDKNDTNIISKKPSNIVILVQKEVAERICAKKGKMNLLAISVQLYAKPRILFNVSSDSFWPKPKVDSSLLKIADIKEKPRYRITNIQEFWRVVRIGFSSPRKQLHNNIANGLHRDSNEIKDILISIGIPQNARAQELLIEDWIKIIEMI
jgi:16S rRNA (adenine1518-N6/adenine1519-N6)-dimethyltransferase